MTIKYESDIKRALPNSAITASLVFLFWLLSALMYFCGAALNFGLRAILQPSVACVRDQYAIAKNKKCTPMQDDRVLCGLNLV